MSAEAISIIVTIDGIPYGVDLIGDPDDVMFAVDAGRAVTAAIIGHRSRQRKLRDQVIAASCSILEGQEYTRPQETTRTCTNCNRMIRWTPTPGLLHVGRWRHDTPATPDTRCEGAEPR